MNIAKWDGTNWSALGSGLTGKASVSALVATGGDLFVGGRFDSAGGNSSTNIAVWHVPQSLDIARNGSQAVLSWPATGTNFVLEVCHALESAEWADTLQVPVILDDRCFATNDISGAARFYRLRRK